MPSVLVRSTNMKLTRPSGNEGTVDENGDYFTPDGDYTSQIKTHTTISPEESIVRLVSSKIISNGSPKTSINFKKSVKRMRNVTNSDLIPSLVSDGIASRVITSSLISIPISVSKSNKMISENPMTSITIEAEAQVEVDVDVEVEVGKHGIKDSNVAVDQYNSKKRRVLIIEEIPNIHPITVSDKIIVSTCTLC